jgi:lipopolysaccharide biosynthesis glycosyltransferase
LDSYGIELEVNVDFVNKLFDKGLGMKKKILNVLYQTDNNYAVVTGVSIASLLENNKDLDEIVIYLIDGGIVEHNLDNMKELVSKYGRTLEIIDGKDIEKKLKAMNCRPYKGSYVTYYKLLAYEFIKTKTDRILMLDGDILVVESLSDVLDICLDGYIMAEVVDPYMPKYLIDKLNLPKNQPYYNAGVMLVNQRMWRNEKCGQKLKEHWTNIKSDYLFADQDITNVLFGDKIKELDLKYNFYSKNYMLSPYEDKLMNLNSDMLEKIRATGPSCIHCIDESWRSRPWFKGNTHSMKREWDYYLEKTPWGLKWEKLEIKLNLYNKIDKILYKILPRLMYVYLLKIVSSVFAVLNISKKLLDDKKMNIKS